MSSADELQVKLNAEGWFISADGLKILCSADHGNADCRTIMRRALDSDIKEIGAPVLTSYVTNKQAGKLVVQLQKIRNVSAPKSNQDSQAAPRLLRIGVTDGHTSCQLLELESIPSLSLHKTAPGSKLLLHHVQARGGYILVDNKTCTFLGGRVESLYEKWELSKTMLKQAHGGSNQKDLAPPWVNFGQKIVKGSAEVVKGFKSLADKHYDGDNGTKEASATEFDAQRQDAIKEVASGAVKKVFGKGRQENVTNKYEAQTLQRQQLESRPRQSKGGRRGRRGGGAGGGRDDDEYYDEGVPTRPSDKVSLFSFLEDKFSDKQESRPTPIPATNSHSQYNANLNKDQDLYRPGKPEFVKPPVRPEPARAPPKMEQTINRPPSSNRNEHGANKVTNNRPGQAKPPVEHQTYRDSKNSYHEDYQGDGGNGNNRRANSSRTNNVRNTNALTDDFNKLSVNAQFATKSFQKYINVAKSNSNNRVDNQMYAQGRSDTNNYIAKSQSQESQGNYNKASANRRNNSVKGNVITNISDCKAIENKDSVINKRNKHDAFSNLPVKQMNNWNVGDECMAKYWEDNQYYRAKITATTDKTCVVNFLEYGNLEEVLTVDCISFEHHSSRTDNSQDNAPKPRKTHNNRYFTRTKQ